MRSLRPAAAPMRKLPRRGRSLRPVLRILWSRDGPRRIPPNLVEAVAAGSAGAPGGGLDLRHRPGGTTPGEVTRPQIRPKVPERPRRRSEIRPFVPAAPDAVAPTAAWLSPYLLRRWPHSTQKLWRPRLWWPHDVHTMRRGGSACSHRSRSRRYQIPSSGPSIHRRPSPSRTARSRTATRKALACSVPTRRSSTRSR